MTAINVILTLIALPVAVPFLVLALECFAAVFQRARRQIDHQRVGHVAVLVPAHNEEAGIVPTLESIKPQLRDGDRLLVIADNCDDQTAAVAEAGGAQVIQRRDAVRRGKGFALQAGVAGLTADPPDVLIVIDADCRLEPGSIDALASVVERTGRPAQACNLSLSPNDPSPRDVISSFAVLVKNLVRPLGLQRLGLPCLLTGTGSAFPWRAMEAGPFGGDHLAEDMQMGVNLVLNGLAPIYCEAARVTSLLPSARDAFHSQRQRWEQGHLHTLLTQVPRLLLGFIRRPKISTAATLFDVAVPPLSLLAILGVAAFAVVLLMTVLAGASWWPLAILGGSIMAASGTLAMAWWKFARKTVPLKTLVSIPIYAVIKLPIYLGFVFNRQRQWVRTKRDEAVPAPPASP